MSTFNTERLQQLVAYAIKGAGFNKLLDISNDIGISVAEGKLYLNTTDGTNYLCVQDACVADDMDIVVNADLFSKLISKITSDTVDMEISDNVLVIKGNGTYKLGIEPNEQGDNLVFPDKFPVNTEEIGTISATDLVAVASTIKTSLDTNVGSIYANYYFGDVVASTDRAMMSVFNKKLVDNAYLLNREFIDLVCMSNTDAVMSKSEDMIVAEMNVSEKCIISVCTRIPNDVADYKIDGIKKFVSMDISSFCRVRKAELLDLLDRLALFVSKFDDGAVVLHFTDNAIEVSSIASSGVEKVEYTESKDAVDMTIKINIDRLRNQLKAYSSDVVDLYYGSDICIKLVDGNMTQIIALIK